MSSHTSGPNLRTRNQQCVTNVLLVPCEKLGLFLSLGIHLRVSSIFLELVSVGIRSQVCLNPLKITYF